MIQPEFSGVERLPANSATWVLGLLICTVSACSSNPPTALDFDSINARDLLIVDCLLPSQVRQLGSDITYLAPRRAIRTSGAQCALRGGEYVAYDQADYTSALAVWLPRARQGDPEAQTYVGEIYEKGLGTRASYEIAAQWYQRAVEQEYSRAQTNLGYLYESGLGVERDMTQALNLYRRASGFTSAELEFVSYKEIAQRENTRAQSERLNVQVQFMQEQISADQQRLHTTMEQLSASQQQVDKLRNSLKQQSVDSVRQHTSDLQAELEKQEARLENLRQDVHSLEESVSGKRASLEPDAPVSQTPSVKDVEFGSYHALIIGNDTYENLDDLKRAGNDAIAMEQVLRDRYGFNTVLLLNANQKTTLMALERLRATLDEQDNLVIYYAGHGELDKHSQNGYWLPTDSQATDRDKWIANSAITAIIDTMTAKHVLIIADSCYSGLLTQTSLARALPQSDDARRLRWLKAVSRSRVRAVLSSGGNCPMPNESINAEHSVFAGNLLQLLQENTAVMDTYELFFELQQHENTATTQKNIQHVSRYAPIRHSGHQAGEFLFVPRSKLAVER